MDPSIMKLLEEDEDESMHSGADVEALSAELNRDIGGEPAAIVQPPESDAGQVIGQWQTSSEIENGRQIQQKEHRQHLGSSEQHSTGGGLIQPPYVAKPQNEQVKKLEQSNILESNTAEGPKQEVTQQSENLHQQNIVQQSNKQIPTTNLASISSNHSEGHQQHIVQQSNTQQIPPSNQANLVMRKTKAASSIPFQMLIPILQPHLDKDRSMQLQAIFTKLRNNEVSKEDFLRATRNIVGDQMLRQAAQKIQMQAIQVQAAQNSQTNTNSFSLQAPASSQQISSSGAQQITGPQSFPASHSMPQSQNLKANGSPPRQPYVPSTTFQVHPGTSFTSPRNNTKKSQEVETGSDGKGPHSVQNFTNNTNMANPERDISMVSLQSVNKQQQATQIPQSSFSISGSTSGYHTHAYPRPSVSSSTSPRSSNVDSHTRQVSHTQGVVSTQIRPTQSTNIMNVPKYDQNAANESKRQQAGPSTSHFASQHNPLARQLDANKEQNDSGFKSMAYVKQEVVDQSSEPPNKSHIVPSGVTSLRTAHVNQKNSALGSSRMMGTTQVSGPVPIQTDQSVQVSSATLPLSGATMKTPSKKPTVGQKKPLEALGSSPPMSSKRQKTSGTSIDQSIEQLNDVTAVSGVDLREEEEQLLSGPKEENQASEATRRVVQEEEERLLLQQASLRKKLSDIMFKCGLKNIGGDVERCLSMCVEERLKGLLCYLIRLSKQRVDLEKSRHRFVITSDVRHQILLMNQKAKEEWDKKQAEECDKLRKVNEMDGSAGVDAEKDKEEGRSKTLKANKEEDDKMRATAANVAARAAVGGDDMLSKWQLMAEQARQKRDGVDGASGSQQGKSASSKSLLSSGRGSKEKQEFEKKGSSAFCTSGSMRRFGRNSAQAYHPKVARNISVKDVIAALETEPQMSKSSLIYRLYERLSGDSPAE
ncbi:hypothetical protein C4D60_Mb04t13920 [Musa balbisiana]|uniref:RST domain-containing protein n=1 Tax=Musa balbisiana TaxID=52838 RepID=A0A4S8KBV5_MUSBA|nr:hypothetical protein C4D60_Mb04t13920 [Musa balbisiana]